MEANSWPEILERIFGGFRVVNNATPSWLAVPGTGRRLMVDQLYPDLGLVIQGQDGVNQAELSNQAELLLELCHKKGVTLVEIPLSQRPQPELLESIQAALSATSRRVAQARGLEELKLDLLPRLAEAKNVCRQIRVSLEAPATNLVPPASKVVTHSLPVQTTRRPRPKLRIGGLLGFFSSNRSSLVGYVAGRLLTLPFIILLVTFILFLIILQLPVEERVMVYVPTVNPHMTPEQWEELVNRLIDRYGLDEPLPIQYANWLKNLAQGNLGQSPTWRQPVLEGLLQRIPATLELSLAALIPSILLSLGLGSLAARYQNRLPDVLMQVVAFLGWAVPPFIVGLALLKVFYSRLHWFPPMRLSIWASETVNSDAFRSFTGLYTVDALLNGDFRLFLDALRHLVLPAASLAAVEWALLMRIMRSSIIETMGLDYIVTARAKGLSERQVISNHARRNALLPVVSTTGVAMATLINSIIVVETIFNINGVGRWAAQSILSTDVPVAIGFALFCSVVVALSSLAADILYGIVDPRVRLK